MRDFCLYVDVDATGRMNSAQKDQLRVLLDALIDRRINIFWLVGNSKIKVRHIINIVKCMHSGCKEKGVLVHNEICSSGREISRGAKLLLKKLPLSLYTDERICENDYASLRYGNRPDGCAFNLCLGNTAYLNIDSKLLICPYSGEIVLNSIKQGDPITELFETDAFKAFFLKQIKKRNECKSTCRLFDLCHGGCPAQNNTEKCSILERVEKLKDSQKANREQEIIRLAGLYRG